MSRIYYEKVAPPLKARNLLSEQDIEKLLEAIKIHSPGYLYPMIKMFAETATKVTDILELKWKHVDLDRGVVHFDGGEKSQERTLKISDELVDILSKKRRTSDFVSQTYYKESFTRSKLTRAINEFKEKGLYNKPWGPLDLRHSFAVNFLAKGGDINQLQKILGHGSVFVTRRLYGEAAIEKTARETESPSFIGIKEPILQGLQNL